MTRAADPVLSVIVVSWNCREWVLGCLAALERHSAGVDLEVVLVDNASSDGTVEAVRRSHPGVSVVEPGENLGFPAANNLGAREARGRHLLLLNPDTEVRAGAIEACVETLERRPEVGAVGCRLVYPDGRLQPECARRHYRLQHLVWEAFYLHVLFSRSPVFAHQLMGDWDHLGRRDVEALSGAFLMVRRSDFDAVGGVPTELFMYHEDLALCLRLDQAGRTLAFVGDVETVHHGGASSSRSPSRLELLEGEVRVRLIRERSGPLAGALARLLFGLREGVRLTLALVTWPLPPVRRRWPQVADVGKHLRLLLWTVAPDAALRDVPRGRS